MPPSRFRGCASVADMLLRLPAELRALVRQHTPTPTALALLMDDVDRPVPRAVLSLAWCEILAANCIALAPALPALPWSHEPLFVHTAEARAAMCGGGGSDDGHADPHRFPLLDIVAGKFNYDDDADMEAMLRSLVLGPLAGARLLAATIDAAVADWRSHKPLRAAMRVLATATGDAAQRVALAGSPLFSGAELAAACRHGDAALVRDILADVRGEPRMPLMGAIVAGSDGLVVLVRAQLPHTAVSSDELIAAVELSRDTMFPMLLRRAAARLVGDLDPLCVACVEHGRLDLLVAVFAAFGSRIRLSWLPARCTRRQRLAVLQALQPQIERSHWLQRSLARLLIDNWGDDVAAWLAEQRIAQLPVDAMELAAEQGNVELVRWLHGCGVATCRGTALCDAARNGHAATVAFLLRHRICRDDFALRAAMRFGHVAVVEVLAGAGLPCPTAWVCEFEVLAHPDAVKALFAQRRDVDWLAVAAAAGRHRRTAPLGAWIADQVQCSQDAREE
ncbi:hypothetical protein HK105_200980 [Polyrhizophydium stewartii]|uniref:Ankyrin repeat domain containing protein n=1 Tax=Polyrhizophydium stewartii TaxID=2732419 RepID=A0ABR4NII9_9FUNG